MTGKVFLLLLVLALNPSCYPMKSGATKSGKKLYEDFYLGEKGMQYFIKPLKFNSDGDELLLIDFTFRQGGDSMPPVVANFTLLDRFPANTPKLPLDSIGLKTGDAEYLLSNLAPIFNFNHRKYMKYRYSSRLTYQELHSFVCSEDKKINDYKDGKARSYSPSRRTSKALAKLCAGLFSTHFSILSAEN